MKSTVSATAAPTTPRAKQRRNRTKTMEDIETVKTNNIKEKASTESEESGKIKEDYDRKRRDRSRTMDDIETTKMNILKENGISETEEKTSNTDDSAGIKEKESKNRKRTGYPLADLMNLIGKPLISFPVSLLLLLSCLACLLCLLTEDGIVFIFTPAAVISAFLIIRMIYFWYFYCCSACKLISPSSESSRKLIGTSTMPHRFEVEDKQKIEQHGQEPIYLTVTRYETGILRVNSYELYMQCEHCKHSWTKDWSESYREDQAYYGNQQPMHMVTQGQNRLGQQPIHVVDGNGQYMTLKTIS